MTPEAAKKTNKFFYNKDIFMSIKSKIVYQALIVLIYPVIYLIIRMMTDGILDSIYLYGYCYAMFIYPLNFIIYEKKLIKSVELQIVLNIALGITIYTLLELKDFLVVEGLLIAMIWIFMGQYFAKQQSIRELLKMVKSRI